VAAALGSTTGAVSGGVGVKVGGGVRVGTTGAADGPQAVSATARATMLIARLNGAMLRFPIALVTLSNRHGHSHDIMGDDIPPHLLYRQGHSALSPELLIRC
jgi:hypothetical protein